MSVVLERPAIHISRPRAKDRTGNFEKIDSERLSLISRIQGLIPGYVPKKNLPLAELEECFEWCKSAEY